jgi:hypothetical protein
MAINEENLVRQAQLRLISCNCLDEEQGQCLQCKCDRHLIEKLLPKKGKSHAGSGTPEIWA